jgi:chromosome partitioning protein
MKVISIISQKGGAGKTTLAINLAVASELQGKSSVIFDIDPQASSMGWKDSRVENFPAVISLHAARINHYLDIASTNDAKLVIFDTAPHSQKDALDAAQFADLVLIPCKPSLIDLRAINSTIKICQIAQKPALVILMQTQSHKSLTEQAAEAIQGYDVDLCPITIGNRIAFVHAFTEGKGVIEIDPKSKASSEIKNIFSFILNYLENKND